MATRIRKGWFIGIVALSVILILSGRDKWRHK